MDIPQVLAKLQSENHQEQERASWFIQNQFVTLTNKDTDDDFFATSLGQMDALLTQATPESRKKILALAQYDQTLIVKALNGLYWSFLSEDRAIEIIETLFKHPEKPCDSAAILRETIRLRADAQQKERFLTLLAGKGLDFNSAQEMAPLVMIMQRNDNRDFATIQFFLEHGADPDLQGESARQYAVRTGNNELIDLFEQHKPVQKPVTTPPLITFKTVGLVTCAMIAYTAAIIGATWYLKPVPTSPKQNQPAAE